MAGAAWAVPVLSVAVAAPAATASPAIGQPQVVLMPAQLSAPVGELGNPTYFPPLTISVSPSEETVEYFAVQVAGGFCWGDGHSSAIRIFYPPTPAIVPSTVVLHGSQNPYPGFSVPLPPVRSGTISVYADVPVGGAGRFLSATATISTC